MKGPAYGHLLLCGRSAGSCLTRAAGNSRDVDGGKLDAAPFRPPVAGHPAVAASSATLQVCCARVTSRDAGATHTGGWRYGAEDGTG